MFSDDSARLGAYDPFYGDGIVGTQSWYAGTVSCYGGYGTHSTHCTIPTVPTVPTVPYHPTVPPYPCTVPFYRALLLKFDNIYGLTEFDLILAPCSK